GVPRSRPARGLGHRAGHCRAHRARPLPQAAARRHQPVREELVLHGPAARPAAQPSARRAPRRHQVTPLAADFTAPSISYAALAPILIVSAAAIVGVLVDAFAPRAGRWSAQVGVALAGLVGAFIAVCLLADHRSITAAGAVAVDGPTL